MARSQVMSDEEVLAIFRSVSNWGRWGPKDEMGTLNYITRDKVRQAAALVRSGRVVSVAHDLDFEQSPKNLTPAIHRMIYCGTDPQNSIDELTIATHGYVQTHLDALIHTYFRGQTYNGRSVEEIVPPEGPQFASIYAQREGVITRGVLLDIARARNVHWLDPSDTVSAADLDAAEHLAGVNVMTGDAAFVRIGLGAREAATGPEDLSVRVGLSPDCLPWLHQRKVALFASDCQEKLPPPYPGVGYTFHIGTLVFMGLMLLDCAAVEGLAQACQAEGRNEFMLIVAPLRIPRGTGSQVNPLCVF